MKMKLLFMSPLLFWCLLDYGASGVDIDSVLLMEDDSVTVHTGVEANQQDKIRWYFNDIRIAQITGDLSKICTDVQCNKGTERFRGRLKMDHQTGSLTIMNTRTTDSGVYKLLIKSSNNIDSENHFIVIVHCVPAVERDTMKKKSVKEGESVTLVYDVVKNPSDLKMYFNDTLIFVLTGHQSKICTDEQCDERFRDRLTLNETGSVTITNTRTTDSGLYKLQINSSRFNIIKTFSVTVTAVTDSTVVAVVAAVTVVAVLLVAAAFVIYCHHRGLRHNGMEKGRRMPPHHHDLKIVEEWPLISDETLQMAKKTSNDQAGNMKWGEVTERDGNATGGGIGGTLAERDESLTGGGGGETLAELVGNATGGGAADTPAKRDGRVTGGGGVRGTLANGDGNSTVGGTGGTPVGQTGNVMGGGAGDKLAERDESAKGGCAGETPGEGYGNRTGGGAENTPIEQAGNVTRGGTGDTFPELYENVKGGGAGGTLAKRDDSMRGGGAKNTPAEQAGNATGGDDGDTLAEWDKKAKGDGAGETPTEGDESVMEGGTGKTPAEGDRNTTVGSAADTPAKRDGRVTGGGGVRGTLDDRYESDWGWWR